MLSQVFKKFLLRLTIISMILLVIATILYLVLPSGKFSPATPFLVVFFYVVTALLYYILLKAASKRFSSFINQFMIITVVKLFAYIIILAIYVFVNKPDAIPFIIAFLLLYFIYLIFEITVYMGDQKKMTKKEN